MTDPWNTLEVVKLVVGVLTPLTVAGFGWFVSRRLKQLDLAQWTNQKLIEKRLSVYDIVAPRLNKLLCFYTWVGYWKDVSPKHVVEAKRELDQTMNIYRHLFDEDVYASYQSYIHMLFETYTGPGHDARIRSVIQGPNGDRTKDCAYQWEQAWVQRFSPNNVESKENVQKAYGQLMESLRKSLGVRRGQSPLTRRSSRRSHHPSVGKSAAELRG